MKFEQADWAKKIQSPLAASTTSYISFEGSWKWDVKENAITSMTEGSVIRSCRYGVPYLQNSYFYAKLRMTADNLIFLLEPHMDPEECIHLSWDFQVVQSFLRKSDTVYMEEAVTPVLSYDSLLNPGLIERLLPFTSVSWNQDPHPRTEITFYVKFGNSKLLSSFRS